MGSYTCSSSRTRTLFCDESSYERDNTAKRENESASPLGRDDGA